MLGYCSTLILFAFHAPPIYRNNEHSICWYFVLLKRDKMEISIHKCMYLLINATVFFLLFISLLLLLLLFKTNSNKTHRETIKSIKPRTICFLFGFHLTEKEKENKTTAHRFFFSINHRAARMHCHHHRHRNNNIQSSNIADDWGSWNVFVHRIKRVFRLNFKWFTKVNIEPFTPSLSSGRRPSPAIHATPILPHLTKGFDHQVYKMSVAYCDIVRSWNLNSSSITLFILYVK